MKASIIIPALNEANNIKDVVAAAFAQDYPSFEVIVADNGSTDDTGAIASRLGAKVVVEKRKGTMWACEAGRKIATGSVIVRLDADCLPEKDWLTKGVKYFSDRRVVVVSGPYDYFDGPKSFRFLSSVIQKYVYVPTNRMLSFFRVGGITLGGNTFMRASALESVGGFNTSIVFYGDDTDVPKRLAPKGKIIFTSTLVMKTSARRFKAEGTLKIGATYIFHFFKTVIVRKPLTPRTSSEK